MTVPRLYLAEPLTMGRQVRLAGDRAHYLRTVLRLRGGQPVRLFNAADGEWRARFTAAGRHEALLAVEERLRPPVRETGPTLIFAPIRRNRLEWLIEKAVELGAARLVPVITQRTVVKPVSAARLETIAIEAAEQCERLSVPEIKQPQPFATWLANRRLTAPLLFADEGGGGVGLATVTSPDSDVEMLVGPEGGFALEERRRLLASAGVVPVTLGPRVLRAETAACYLLAGWQVLHER